MNHNITELLQEAGDILVEAFHGFQNYREKERYHLQSEYDVKVDNFLRSRIEQLYPEDSIYSEESEELRKNSASRWVIDPIDGTNYFIFGEPFFSISVAKETAGSIVEAHVFNPISGEYYYSDSSCAVSYLNGERITVSDTMAIEDSLLAFGFSANPSKIKPYLDNYSEIMSNCRKALPWIGPALSICNVARGRIEALIDYGCSFEGQAAASLILQNAGGKCRDISGREYDSRVTGGIFSNGLVAL